MKRCILFCIFMLFSVKMLGQHPLNMEKFADSLNHLLKTAPNDSVKAATYFNLVTYWMPKDSLKVDEYLKKGHTLAGNNTFLKGSYYAKMGYFYYFHRDLENSRKNYKTADSLLQNVHNVMAYKLLADVWNNIGIIDQINGDDDDYIRTLLDKAIPYAEKANDPNRVATYYISLGLCFMNLEQYNKSIEYFKKAEAILIKDKSQQFRLVSMYNRAAEAYLLTDKLPEAKQIIDKAQNIFNENPSSEQIALFYMVNGIYYHKIKMYTKALRFFNLAVQKASGPNKIYHIQEININKLETLIEDKKYDEALLLAKQLENDELFTDIPENRALALKSLAKIYFSTNQLNLAYTYLNQYAELKNTIYKEDLQEQINRLETKFNTQQKEKQLSYLQNQQKEVALKLKNSRLYTALAIAGMIIFLLAAALIFAYYRNNKKAMAQKDIIHKQKIAEAEREKQLLVTQSILEGQEKERERIAKDLHDGLGGMLAAISIKFSAWEAKYLKDGRDDFEKSKQQLDNALAELRSISRNLMPESLLKYGLRVALNDLCEFYQTPQLAIDCQCYGLSDTLKLSVQLSIYRIIQELLSNAVKHAQPTQILVQCSQNENRLFITVEDNGKGYNVTENQTVKGMGLGNVQNRVAFLNGKMEIFSSPNEGTTVNIEIELGTKHHA